jgi:hypothetical protein
LIRAGIINPVRIAAVSLGMVLSSVAVAGPQNFPEIRTSATAASRDLGAQAEPDILGSGHVSTAGNLWLKTTNIGLIGNPFTAQSGDPSAQWPGPSGVEYLYLVGLWVGAKDPTQVDPDLIYRVSHNTEWRPPSLSPQDRIYESFEGDARGVRLHDDDGDGKLDEDRLDGRDNDGDGLTDEDFDAASQQMFSCVLRDDTHEALEAVREEPHVPLGLEAHQRTFAFSVPGTNDYTAVQYVIRNVSNRTLDSVFVAFEVDQDVGPVSQGRFFVDDLPDPRVPQGPDTNIALPTFRDPMNPNTPYIEFVSTVDIRYERCRCARTPIWVNGFTMIDNDGDGGLTKGASTFLLLDHTIRPLLPIAPDRVQFRMYKHMRSGLPFSQGGPPSTDIERYELISSTQNVDQISGRITAEPAAEPGDYFVICSIGPYLDLEPGESISVVWALGVQEIDYSAPANDLQKRYDRVIQNAVSAQINYNGVYEIHPGQLVPPQCGKEAPVKALPGTQFIWADCVDLSHPLLGPRPVFDFRYTWFDFDCNVCTGIPGHTQKHWRAAVPPESPTLELVPGDDQVKLRWDNRSEYVPDPQKDVFDFKGYGVWRAAGWDRPRGSIGPTQDLWENIANFFLYDDVNPLIEKSVDPSTGNEITIETANVLVNRSWTPGNPYPRLIHPQDVPCIEKEPGVCDTSFSRKFALRAGEGDTVIENYPVVKYPVGRYEMVDPQAKNGFTYFYSIVAFDSTGKGVYVEMLEGNRKARESEAVVPQQGPATDGAGNVYAVPNPYRSDASWDLQPNANDPTGTHIDFFGMPANWTQLRIYTVSGDLVQEIRPYDLQPNGKLQRETPDDGQASWNLITRNGQEVVSGIYLFTVEADGTSQRGKFVIIR